MADFQETVDDSVTASDSALTAFDALRLVVDSVAVADAALTAFAALREASDSAIASDSVLVALSALRVVSDVVSVSDEARTLDALISDAETVVDDLLVELVTLNVEFSDAVTTDDLVGVGNGQNISRAITDTISVSDALARSLSRTTVKSDSVTASDSALRTTSFERALSDALSVSDALVSTPTVVFGIDLARALTESRVRIDFEAPALINAALRSPASYTFRNLSLGAIEVTPLAVQLPPGQTNPLYVEVDTTEHTDGLTYDVALAASIRGAGGEFGNGVPYAYTGIGVAPQLQVVIAVSSTEVEVHFTEALADNADVNTPDRYQWDGGLNTIAVRAVVGNVVFLQTSSQTPGQLYTLTVQSSPPIGVVVDDEVDVDDGDFVLAEFITLNVIIADDLTVTDEVLFPPRRILMVVGYEDAASAIQSSLDGVTWYREPNVPSDHTLWRAASSDTVNVVTSSTGVYTSDGNGAWDVIEFGNDALGICYSPELGIFVVGSHNGFFVSSDAITWTFHAADTSPFSFYFWAVCWSSALGIFVAGGNDGTLFQTSPDGINWTRHADAHGFLQTWWNVAWCSGIGQFVAVGNSGGEIQSSPDGVAWTVRTPDGGFAGSWSSVAASSSRFVVTGVDGGGNTRLQTSDDGIVWTEQVPPSAFAMTGVTYRADLGLFVACDEFVRFFTSPDGVTWTQRFPDVIAASYLWRGVG